MTDAAKVSAPPLLVRPDVGTQIPISDTPIEEPRSRIPPKPELLVRAVGVHRGRVSALVARQVLPETSNADAGNQRAGSPRRRVRFVAQTTAEIEAQNNPFGVVCISALD